MEKAARDAFEAGLIEKRHYLIYKQGTKQEAGDEEEETAGGH